mgnify:CR=1 FL=1
MPRHGSESLTLNEEELYEEFFEGRGVQKILHYRTAKWPPLTAKIRRRFSTTGHVWTLGDRYWKLANTYYGNSKLWWVIAWYNEKPTEAGIQVGTVLYIPKPLEKVLSYFKFGS